MSDKRVIHIVIKSSTLRTINKPSTFAHKDVVLIERSKNPIQIWFRDEDKHGDGEFDGECILDETKEEEESE